VRLTGIDLILKTILDFGLAFGALVIFSPVLLMIALLVKLDSPGPIFYRRRVMGVNGKHFDAFKFRTMDQRSDEILSTSPVLMKEYLENFKIKDDPRVTRLGKFLRKTSLDELPQLFNVLRNEMSIAGPRMITRKR
jgi:lipopolysaccharide/colanic/teichoic acid biosynthesis glycosyltransferase